MNRREAHRLLDHVRAGTFPTASETTITEALRLTGDIPPPDFQTRKAAPLVLVLAQEPEEQAA